MKNKLPTTWTLAMDAQEMFKGLKDKLKVLDKETYERN